MTPYELLDLMISIGNRIDIQWGLFITVHMAIFGGIIYVDRPLTSLEKIGAVTIYSGFAVINYWVTRDLAVFMHSANQEIARYATDACCNNNLLVKQVAEKLEGASYRTSQNVLFLSHLAMALLVTLSVIFDKQVSVLTSTEKPGDEDS